MNDNSPSKLTIIIVGVLALLMIAILPIAPALFRSTAPTLTFSPLQVDDPLTQLSDDSIGQLFERDTIADLTLTIDTPISELNNHSLREVFESGSILEDKQLITNGDFSDGKTSWSENTVGSVLSGIYSYTAASQNNAIYQSLPIVQNNKYYLVSRLKANQSNQAQLNVGGGIRVFHSGSGNFEIISSIGEWISPNDNYNLGIRDRLTTGWTQIDVDYIYTFNISTLIANKQYSPMYNTTFSLMTDEQIKAQMDAFIGKPYEFMNYDLLGWYPTQSQLDYYYSLYQKLLDLDGGLPAQYSNGIYSNNEKIIYVTPLITAGQYSPLFDSTFNLMSDADIEDQLDDWLVRGFNYPQLTYELTEAQLLYFATLNQELIDEDGGLPNQIQYEIFTLNEYIYDLVPLKANHQYSPLYEKTFDVMSDAEIIAQMNAWHYENLLP